MSVTIALLPKKDDESNQGIDDFLGAGGSLDELGYVEYTGDRLGLLPREWPVLGKEAFHGPAGRIVERVKPNTEADPVALLLVLLAAYGNAIGRGAHFVVEDDKHFAKLFVLLVGRSSKARKGVAQTRVNNLMGRIEELWVDRCNATGLASGEGLTHRVRDRREKVNSEGKTEVIDAGVADKRLLVEEPEFAGLLTTMKREGNNLSMQVRKAWDNTKLQNLSKNASETATNSHISIVAHTNQAELNMHLTHEKLGGGLINRFLPILVRRWQLLPEGGKPDIFEPSDLQEIEDAISFGKKKRQIGLSAVREEDYGVSAKELWYEVYEELSEPSPGLLGEATARSEAQVRRLAMIYAALDLSEEVEVVHLMAALTVWAYVFESCKMLFGGKIGDTLSDDILDALKDAGDAGMTQSEIHELFSNNKRVSLIRAALNQMESEGWIHHKKEKSGGPGPPTLRWWINDV
jgi:hypothetical protein